MATTTTTTTSTITKSRKVRVGIRSTPELRSVLQQTLALSETPQTEETDEFLPPIDTNEVSTHEGEETKEGEGRNETVVAAALKPISVSLARETIRCYFDRDGGDGSSSSFLSESVPLDVIHAAKSILHHCSSSFSDKDEPTLITQLESAIASSGGLRFVSPNTPSSSSSSSSDNPTQQSRGEGNGAHQRRIERLRLSAQERSYHEITSNLGSTKEDDATVKSMLYATSVGLNMIVAPLSFGVFMYFFSGALFSYWVDGDDKDGGREKLDIRKVIVGVVSGVIMLFIEMILFVIRNHEMDKYVTKKSKKDKKNPFGYSQAHAKRTFNG